MVLSLLISGRIVFCPNFGPSTPPHRFHPPIFDPSRASQGVYRKRGNRVSRTRPATSPAASQYPRWPAQRWETHGGLCESPSDCLLLMVKRNPVRILDGIIAMGAALFGAPFSSIFSSCRLCPPVLLKALGRQAVLSEALVAMHTIE